jgi:hypothetical protein
MRTVKVKQALSKTLGKVPLQMAESAPCLQGDLKSLKSS